LRRGAIVFNQQNAHAMPLLRRAGSRSAAAAAASGKRLAQLIRDTNGAMVNKT
jgi:hypothetical protein